MTLRCAVVAADVLTRTGLRSLLGAVDGVVVLVEEAVAPGRAVDPDVVVLHLDQDTGHGCITRLAATAPVVVVSGSAQGDRVLDVLASGASGYVAHADLDGAELGLALLDAARGLRHVSPSAAAGLAGNLPRPPEQGTESLSVREREVMELVALGAADEAVASALGMSPRTVRNHLASIYLKHHLHARHEAVAWWSGRRPAAGDAAHLPRGGGRRDIEP